MTLPIDTIIQGNCLEVMKQIEDHSVDMVLCDLPFGTTQSKHDCPIDLSVLWLQYRRIIKNTGAFVLFSATDFTIRLGASALDLYRYKYAWVKNKATNHLNSKKQPMRIHEDILVFYFYQPIFYPQMREVSWKGHSAEKCGSSNVYGKESYSKYTGGTRQRYPVDVLYFDRVRNDDPERKHEFQKPVDLCEYLIRTYTNEGDLVLDNCIGSGTTAVAALNTKRHFIGIELSEEYCEIARKRIAEIQPKPFIEELGKWWE